MFCAEFSSAEIVVWRGGEGEWQRTGPSVHGRSVMGRRWLADQLLKALRGRPHLVVSFLQDQYKSP
jgi:hypothetical protein